MAAVTFHTKVVSVSHNVNISFRKEQDFISFYVDCPDNHAFISGSITEDCRIIAIDDNNTFHDFDRALRLELRRVFADNKEDILNKIENDFKERNRIACVNRIAELQRQLDNAKNDLQTLYS